MDRVRFCLEQATRCSERLAAASDPRRRDLLMRERDDWLALAAAPGPLGEPRHFAEPARTPIIHRRH
jgi:hypothetical protein